MHAGLAPSALLVHATEGMGMYTGTHCLSLQCLVPREVAQRNSPILCVTQAVSVAASCEVLVAVAQHDSPEFRRQSQEYSQALRSAGWSVSLLDLASVDHFDIIEKLSEETYVLTQVILNMIARA